MDDLVPRAWAWKDEPSGIEVYSGWDEPRPTNGSEPLYDQATIEAAVAAERERCAKVERELSIAHMALQAIRSHWREFGPEFDFDETLEKACKVLEA